MLLAEALKLPDAAVKVTCLSVREKEEPGAPVRS